MPATAPSHEVLDERARALIPLGARHAFGSVPIARVFLLVLIALGSTTSFAAALFATEPARARDDRSATLELLGQTFPRLEISADPFGRTLLTGFPMESAPSEDLAVDRWLERFASALAIDLATLELLSVSELSDRRATVFAYRPWALLSGESALSEGEEVEIEGGAVRLLVRGTFDRAGRPRYSVTHAAAHTALPPRDGYPAIEVAAAEAERIARAAVGAANVVHPARLVIVPSATTQVASRLAWHVPASSDAGAWTVRIDPRTGAVLEVRDELLDVDVVGSVEGLVSPAPRPDLPSNPPSPVPLAHVQVSIAGGTALETEIDGSFLIPFGGTQPVEVQVALSGAWVTIEDLTGAPFLFSTMVAPPGNATLLLDPGGDEFSQAQLNGYHYTTRTHDFFRDRTPSGIQGIDVPIPCRVNLNDSCNATFDPINQRMNFYVAGDGCANSAFSNVISHEYGHFVVDQLGLAQGAFGEGFGDIVAMLIDDDPIIGRDFSGLGTVVRDPIAADVQYPCTGQVHACGQLIGAVWWKIREQLGLLSGSAAGLEEARQLFVDWSLLTIGGMGGSSAHPGTALEVLAVDDDDAFLDNGTPHFLFLCEAFGEHSIDCPPLAPVVFSYPQGHPTRFSPTSVTAIHVEVSDGTESHLPSSLRLHLAPAGSGSFSEFTATSLGGGSYRFDVPPQSCGTAIEWAISATTTLGAEYASPIAGVLTPFSSPVYEGVTLIETDSFELESGWSVGEATDDAVSGVWERVVPQGTAAAPGADHSEPGAICFVTGQALPGDPLGTADVDGGTTTLRSPSYDLSGGEDFEIGYWRWFSNEVGAAPQSDVMRVEISNDGGASWTLVELVGPTGPEASGGWYEHRFAVGSFVTPTAETQVRFRVSDLGTGSLVEAAIDDFEIIRRECLSLTTPPFRRGDTNGDFELTLGDVIGVLTYLFASESLACLDAADTNDSGDLTLGDAILLLQFLFAGGAELPSPSAGCGTDPTADALECATGSTCP